jgi:hypothetical protein
MHYFNALYEITKNEFQIVNHMYAIKWFYIFSVLLKNFLEFQFVTHLRYLDYTYYKLSI